MVLGSSKKTKLFIDTNIVIYRAQQSTAHEIKTQLIGLESKYTLVTSNISRYEILKHSQLYKNNEQLQLLNLFESFDITEDVIITAGLLCKVLFPNLNESEAKKKDADLIIAASTLVNNSLLLTVNRNDFPPPYFDEIAVTPILYKRIPNKTSCLLLCLLKPNISRINEEISKVSQEKIITLQ